MWKELSDFSVCNRKLLLNKSARIVYDCFPKLSQSGFSFQMIHEHL